MKRQIRTGVFETNSSSCHSVSITRDKEITQIDTLEYTDDDKAIVHFGEFGWGVDTFNDSSTKLNYLMTMAAETSKVPDSIEEFFDSEDFHLIEDAVKSHNPDCEGIYLADEISIETFSYRDQEYKRLKFDGYIDHQSCEDYSSAKDFLDSYGITAEDFIFNPKVILHIDNDNH